MRKRPADEVVLAWSATQNRLLPAATASGRVDVADSWLVNDGAVRGLEHHTGRFTESCRRQHGVDPMVTSQFLAAALAALPVHGRWFPRVEFEAGAGMRLRLRPAPEPGPGCVLATVGEPDRRSEPAVKGPDLAWLAGLRRGAAAGGADEVLLVSGSGTVLEGALSAVLWWRGEVLCAPPLSLPVLPSVTRRLLLEIASATGTEIRFEACRVQDLDGTEIWTVSALHGIRPVTAWTDGLMTVAQTRHAPAWQGFLVAQARPLSVATANSLAAIRRLPGRCQLLVYPASPLDTKGGTSPRARRIPVSRASR